MTDDGYLTEHHSIPFHPAWRTTTQEPIILSHVVNPRDAASKDEKPRQKPRQKPRHKLI